MNRPIRIYKYQPYNIHSLANLKSRQIWFSKVASFNDPFERAYVIDQEIADDDWVSLYARLRDSEFRDQVPLTNDELDRRYMTDGMINERFKQEVKEGALGPMAKQGFALGGVCSLTEKNDDILMWAHYADGHRGFCLEFDTSFVPFNELYQVKYQDQIPTFNPIRLFRDVEEAMQIFTTKFTAWSYEKEWRLFHSQGDKAYRYGVKALARIYFGAEMEPTNKDIIAQLLHGSPTKLYQVTRSHKKFMVNFEAKEYTPYDYETRSDARGTRAVD